MKNLNKSEFIEAAAKVIPLMVNEWNNNKLAIFEELNEQSFATYFKGRQTQEKTKQVAPILDSIFARMIQTEITGFMVDEGVGRDYGYRGTPIECKITFGAGNGWTGNGYSKTPWHLLMRFELNEDGEIIKSFAMITNLNNCISQWTAPGTTSNFSTLKFLSLDIDQLTVIVGTITDKTKSGKSGKYILPVMI